MNASKMRVQIAMRTNKVITSRTERKTVRDTCKHKEEQMKGNVKYSRKLIGCGVSQCEREMKLSRFVILVDLMHL